MPDSSFNFIQKLQEHGLLGWIIILALSFWAATVRYLEQLNGDKFSFRALISEVIVCSFVGVVTGMLCRYLEFDEYVTFVLVSVVSHKGTRGFYILKNIGRSELKRIFGGSND